MKENGAIGVNREQELIREAQTGDVGSFDELVRLYDRKILQLIESIVGSRHDAYDVYQDTFIRAFRKLDTFRGESAFGTWLSRIAINLSLNWCKRQRRKELFSMDAKQEQQGGWDLIEGAKGSEKRVLQDELMSHVDVGLKKLPHKQRSIFILKHQHGYKIKEIAGMMNCAEGTVKQHLFRATAKLKEMLTPYYEN